ncbi:PREDICTED: eukaryotic translation initiation factor 4E-like [Amphimedon queenslandica]|uniref:EIF-4F 25 kDa subunit n=1 Tax=Amphimedon queenslandica TaxID=400682 RepID=A0A1X7VIM6_AMPQE|nr:PREDICTED: eukaryotic translation initiation factor 4E-like [Amphimedon queenslandica]|eukprot:XP_003384312.1 PREDICTED: eukaryotic translation initiation factor 4E-like [Amphimedon queenslandica]
MASKEPDKPSTSESEKSQAPLIASVPAVTPERHPLQNKWVLWYLKNDKQKEWKDNLRKIICIDTVEDFWSVYNHIKPPSQISSGCDYMLFKEGIEPMWEDKTNKDGGRWLLNIDKRDRKDGVLDNVWMETLMCLIGEIFDDSSDDICGAVAQNRTKGDKISIWTRVAKNKDHVHRIGYVIKFFY